MNQDDRQKLILHELNQSYTLSVSQLAQLLQVSEMTVRRDISVLEKNNKVTTFYGGVSLHQNGSVDLSSTQSRTGYYSVEHESLRQVSEKDRIARKAASLIEPSDVLMIDMGSTCHLMVDYIDDSSNHIVYTYSLEVFNNCLRKDNLRTVLCGGYYYENTRMFESPEGVAALKNASFNKAFFGAMGISSTAGVSAMHTYEVATRKAALESSCQKILLVDSTKMGKAWYVKYGDLSDFDILITDDNISTEHINMVRDSGIELIIV